MRAISRSLGITTAAFPEIKIIFAWSTIFGDNKCCPQQLLQPLIYHLFLITWCWSANDGISRQGTLSTFYNNATFNLIMSNSYQLNNLVTEKFKSEYCFCFFNVKSKRYHTTKIILSYFVQIFKLFLTVLYFLALVFSTIRTWLAIIVT